MIRTTAVPRPARIGAALVGVAGIVTLAGCAGGTTTDSAPAPAATTAPSSSTGTGATGSDSGSSSGGGAYADGTYSASGQYATPESVETIEVTLTLADDVITDVEVTGDPQARESQEYQSRFIGGIADEVVGKSIDDISVSRVAGSSLTSGGFNQAVDAIKADAAA
ncbi:FMN-binding protein [Microbacterium sp. LMI1-1-1.1]|uniref:FMN-binding protein n=1 Tax=unclassified Microbacterium TaxID=2609290 RepID=UPI003466667E